MDFTKTKENLERNGFAVSCFDTAAEAVAYLKAQVTDTTVSFGGSVTVQEMGLYDALAEQNQVFWHWRVPAGQTGPEVLAEAMTTEVYFSSVNGLAETGEIINIDGNCNRVAGIFYGHKRVFLLVGENKLAPDYDAALYRARNIAAPKNAQRLGTKTPCAVKGDKCYDCKSPARICRGVNVLWRAPNGAKYEVILIHEPLGY